MKQTVEIISDKTTYVRKVVVISLMIIGFGLFIVGGLLGVSRVNDPKVVEGEPRLGNALSTVTAQAGSLKVGTSEVSYAHFVPTHITEPVSASVPTTISENTAQNDEDGINTNKSTEMKEEATKSTNKESKKTHTED